MQPWENYLFGAVALIIVIIERKSMLRGMGMTEILAPASHRSQRFNDELS